MAKKSIGKGPQALTPAWVVGTYDKDGKPDLATLAYCGIASGNPPSVTVSLREATLTWHNIMERKAFTVNLPPASLISETDYFGLVSGRSADKFARCGLTPVRSSLVDAPYIEQFPLVIECRMLQAVNAGLHTMFIGECLDVKADESILDERGTPDLAKAGVFVCGPGSNYYGIGPAVGRSFSDGKKMLK